MARTKQTSRASQKSKSKYKRATFVYNPKNALNQSGPGFNYPGPSGTGSSTNPIDVSNDNGSNMGHDDLDDEVLQCSLRGNIVGLQYYRGMVNNNEMVALVREPHNRYDNNAIRVENVGGQQVGHIKRELAKPMARIIDRGLARVEGVVPFGSNNMYSMCIDLTFWGLPEKQTDVVGLLKASGFYPTVASNFPSCGPSNQSGFGFHSTPPRRTFLSPADMKNELDKLFETLEEGDKTSTTQPAKAIQTEMYTHQKQALHWMIQREKGTQLPPFWETRGKRFFNSVTVFTTDTRPNPVRGGILADDMGLGKTLEMISLILTNFKDDKPLAVPVPGRIRESILVRAKKKAVRLASYKTDSNRYTRSNSRKKKILPSMSNFIDDDEKPSSSYVKKTLRNISAVGNVSSLRRLDHGSYVMKTLRNISAVGNVSSLRQQDDDVDSTDTDGESESDSGELTGVAVMTKKDDPDFCPYKNENLKENMSPLVMKRSKRNVKKPLRYDFEYGSDMDTPLASPVKKNNFSTLPAVCEKEDFADALIATQTAHPDTVEISSDKQSNSQICLDSLDLLDSTSDSSNSKSAAVQGSCDPKDLITTGTALLSQTNNFVESLVVNDSSLSERTKLDDDKKCHSSESHCVGNCEEKQECDTGTVKGGTYDLKSLNNVPVSRCDDKTSIMKSVSVDQHVSVARSRSRRSVKRPARFTVSDSEPEDPAACASPAKKGKVGKKLSESKSSQGLGKGKGKGKGKKKTALKTEEVPPTIVLSCDSIEETVQAVTDPQKVDLKTMHMKSCEVEHALKSEKTEFEVKNVAKTILLDEVANKKDRCKEEDADMSALPDPKISKSYAEHSDNELPDIDEDILCASPGSSKCDKNSGRTQTTGPRATLIVAPLSVLSNWVNQFEDHVHENVHLEIYMYYGSSRIKDPAVLAKQDVVLTTYSTLAADARPSKKQQISNPLLKVEWLRIVLDEGHAIRNPNALQTKAICALKAQRKWILTGTPIQNSMKDLWSLVNFLQINPFTDKQWWRRAIERPLDQGEDRALKRVQHLMSAIAMRRTKTQKMNGKPLVNLPERNVYVEHIKLSEEERQVYSAMQTEGKIIVSKYFKQGTLLHHYGDVLAILMRLRQMCCHPLLVAKAAAAIKEITGNVELGATVSEELREKLISALMMVLGSGSDEECAICLDTLKEPVITYCAHVYCRSCIETVIKNDKARCPLCRGDIDKDKLLEMPPEDQNQQVEECSDVTPETFKSSTKVDALMNHLTRLRQESPSTKSVVVSQFTSLLTLLEVPISANGFRFTRLDGTMTLKDRARSVEEFSDDSPGSPTILLLSLKAGGVGINLTAASRVFLMDPAWNPASEEQCFDRCHRLGQTKDVVITKFIVEDSVEERMMELQEKKRKLMQGAFGAKKETAEERRQNRIKDIRVLMNF